MIGVLVVTHEDLGDHLIRCVSHIIGEKPPHMMSLGIFIQDDPKVVLSNAQTLVGQLDSGDGVLVFSDILGATPCNIATQLIQPGKVECLAGVNVPMLVRALTYRHEPLPMVVEKALSGGQRGVIHIQAGSCHAT